ncbi:MAG: peptidoglycan DD-metalloendopeptidase family protein [Firmicutes bacterium]|nr:peptidoglycan DD-metalloendopeptidase family protein [Bacillota bacterium]
MRNRKFWIALIFGVVLLAGICFQSLVPNANAASSSEIEDQIANMQAQQEALQEAYDQLQQEKAENDSEILALYNEKVYVEQQKGLLDSEIDLINEQISAYTVMIADKQEELDEAEAYLADLNAKYKERIRSMEEDGELSYWSVLFQANSFFDLLDRLNMVEEIAAADQRRLDELSEAAEAVAAAQEVLLQQREALQQTREELDEKQALLDEKTKELNTLLSEMAALGDEYDALMEAKELEMDQVDEEIAQAQLDLEEAERREYLEYMATMTTAAPSTTATTSSTVSSGGGASGSTHTDENGIVWVVPCDYTRVASAFGYRWDPLGSGKWVFHAGVDLAAYCPTEIVATRAGVVVIAKYSSTAGYYVTIDHLDGYQSTYMHMCKFPDVQVGDVVAAGQVIGCVGNTGSSTNDHLHFGIYYNGTAVNPMDYIG